MAKQSGRGWGWWWWWWWWRTRRCCKGFGSAMHTILPFLCGRCAKGGTAPPHRHRHRHRHRHDEAPHVSDNDDDVASSCSGATSSSLPLSLSLSSSSYSSSWWWWGPGPGHGDGRQRRQLSRRRRGPPAGRSWVTGTLYGGRNGRVRVCIQHVGGCASAALLVLELDLTTRALAKEMSNGVLRISLDCDDDAGAAQGQEAAALLSARVWRMYCNGRSCGFAVRRHPSKADSALLELTRSVSAGAGVVNIDMEMDDLDLDLDLHKKKKKKEKEMTEEVVYLRGRFERVVGSADCESFHLVTPGGDGDHEQPLSIFFFRSSCCCSCR